MSHARHNALRRVNLHHLLFCLLGLLLAFSAMRGYRTGLSERGNDFTIFLDAARAASRGESPYGDPMYLYLPVFSCMLAPLAWLPPWLATAVWQAAAWGAVIWSVRIVARLVDPNGVQPWLGWASLALIYRLADSGLAYGQANAFTLLLLVKSIELVCHRHWWVPACLMGVAAAFKILPAVLLGVLLAAGRVRAALVGGGVFVAIAALLPLAVFGADLAIEVHREWYEAVLAPYLKGGDALIARASFVPGQSLVAFGYHLLADLPVSANDTTLRANVLNLAPNVVHWIVRAIVFFHLTILAAFALYSKRPFGSRRFLEVSAFAMCTMLLCAPIVHRAHFIWILPSFALLLSIAGDGRRSTERSLARAGLGLGVALIGLTSSGIVGRVASRWLTAHGALTIGGETVWWTLVLVFLLRSRTKRTAQDPGMLH